MSETSKLKARIAVLEKMDREAATYVESVICMRTGFTGKPPYVGWKGLGRSLNEALDERDWYKARFAELTYRKRRTKSRATAKGVA